LSLSLLFCADCQPITQHMTVDSARNVPIRINFDVTFPSYVRKIARIQAGKCHVCACGLFQAVLLAAVA
jgi:hypothetical protein